MTNCRGCLVSVNGVRGSLRAKLRDGDAVCFFPLRQEADMTIQENWALPMARIEEYLRSLEQARQTAEARYAIDGCEIRLQPLEESKIGSYAFPRTLVTFFGAEVDVRRFHRQFMIRFLTLGG